MFRATIIYRGPLPYPNGDMCPNAAVRIQHLPSKNSLADAVGQVRDFLGNQDIMFNETSPGIWICEVYDNITHSHSATAWIDTIRYALELLRINE